MALPTLRLGDIEFLNSWPVTYALRQGMVGSDLKIISGTPAELNRRLLTGELDSSAVSSMLFLRHAREWVPIPQLCIRSDNAVASVVVVSREPLERLKKKTIAVSNQGATTPVLLKILLRQRNLKFRLEVTSLRYPEILDVYPTALLIGDEALTAVQAAQPWVTWDLGEAWAQWTHTPMVYALWVVRASVVRRHPEIIPTLGAQLLASSDWGKSHRKELIRQMRKIFPWETTFLTQYLDRLVYDLDSKAWAGLKRLSKEAENVGELPSGTTAWISKNIPTWQEKLLLPQEPFDLPKEAMTTS